MAFEVARNGKSGEGTAGGAAIEQFGRKAVQRPLIKTPYGRNAVSLAERHEHAVKGVVVAGADCLRAEATRTAVTEVVLDQARDRCRLRGWRGWASPRRHLEETLPLSGCMFNMYNSA